MVKVYDQYQEMPNVRSGSADNPLSPDEAAAPGRAISRTGQAVMKGASDVIDLQMKAQEKANKVVLNDAFNRASIAAHDLRYNKDKGYLRHKGGDAVKGIDGQPITAYYGDELDKQIGDIRGALGNTAVIEQFDIATADLKTKFRNDAVSYEAEQSAVYAEQVRDATILTSANDLAVDPFGKAAPFYISRARDAAVDKARTAGLDGEAMDIAVKATMGKMHTAVIDRMMDTGQVAPAKTYFEAHRADFGELEAQAVQGKLQKAYDAEQAVATIDSVWSEHGPRVVNAPVNRAAMDAELRSIYKDDPTGLKAAREELQQRVAAWEFQENEQNAGNVSTVWKDLGAGRSFAEVESTRAWLALPGDTQQRIKNGWRAQQSAEANSFEETLNDNAWAYWNSIMNSDVQLRALTPTQVEALVPLFGRKLTMQIQTRRGQVLDADNKAGVAPGKIDTDQFNAYAQAFGLKPFSSNDNDKAKVARVRSRVELKVAEAQSQKGGPLSPQEIDDVLRTEAAKTVMVGNRLRPLATLSAEEAAKVQASGADRTKVLEYMAGQYERTGAPEYEPTEQNINRVYLSLFDNGQFFVDE